MSRPDMIDREDEMARLRRAADEPPQLVIVRGRRRVGKSFLLSRAFAERRLVYFQADEQDEAGHLQLLAREAAELLPGSPPLRFDDWNTALAYFAEQAHVEPLVVVLDEFQWLWDAQPALDSLIQRHWDRWDRDGTPLTLTLSGSSLIHMDRLLTPDRPLYGRAAYRPLLVPLDYRRAAEFAVNADPEERLRRYAVLGGTPQYQRWAGTGPIDDVIRDRILAKGESLYEEPLHLLREERSIRAPGSYFDILRAIAGGATQHNEIGQQAGVDTPSLSKALGRLVDLGYLTHVQPLEHDGFVAKRGIYRLGDPFLHFWFRYLFPHRSRLERERRDEVLAVIAGDRDTFMGLAFEDCCRQWIGRYAHDLPAVEELGSWWDRRGTAEIDVVGVAGRRYSLLGSCKWHRRADAQVLGRLKRDAEALGARAGRAELVVFARGFTDDLHRRARDDGARLVGADELFAGMDGRAC